MKITAQNVQGTIAIPSSKSDAQRAALIASLSENKVNLINYGKSNDELAMLQNCLQLGCEVKQVGSDVSIKRDFNSQISNEFNVNESGLGLRLLVSLLAAVSSESQINGKGSLLQRDQSFFEKHLPAMGVNVEMTDSKLPIQLKGKLKAGDYTVDGSQSSQYISGLLIAFTQVEGETTLRVENLTSRPYVDMTLHTMRQFGLKVDETSKDVFQIVGVQTPKLDHYTVDGDWSSASCLLVGSALGLDIKVTGLSMGSKQADKALINALMFAGCRFYNSVDGMYFDGANRGVLDFDATHCPDLFPALAAYASFTPGLHKIRGVHRLANKESNRGLALQREFGKLGVKIELNDDEMIIHGQDQLASAHVSAHNDHRIAMCLTIAALASKTEIELDGAESVSKSYPDFFKDLKIN